IGLYAVGGLIGLVLSLTRPNGWILLVLGGIGGAVGIFYTLPPFALQYHGVGEVAVAFVFGPIVVLGAYAVQVGALAWEPFLASIPLGLLVAAFLLVNEMPEHMTDPRGGKRTVPARIGLEKSVTLYEILVGFALVLLAVLPAWKEPADCQERAEGRQHPEKAPTGEVPDETERKRGEEQSEEDLSRPREAQDRHGRPFSLRCILLPVGEVSRERDSGCKETEDDGSEGAFPKSGTAERDRGPDGHDGPERQERRQFANPAIAELEGRRAVTPCQDCAPESECGQDRI